MVHTNVNHPMMKAPYEDLKKGKGDRALSSTHQQQQQQPRSPSKSENKYGAWGSLYKNKENFVDMHIC